MYIALIVDHSVTFFIALRLSHFLFFFFFRKRYFVYFFVKDEMFYLHYSIYHTTCIHLFLYFTFYVSAWISVTIYVIIWCGTTIGLNKSVETYSSLIFVTFDDTLHDSIHIYMKISLSRITHKFPWNSCNKCTYQSLSAKN